MTNRFMLLLAVPVLFAASCNSGKKLAKRKAYMTTTYNAFKAVLNDADVTQLNDTIKIVFKTPVLFPFNQATIASEMFPSFDRMAHVMNDHKKTEMLIVGHTDYIGGDNANNQQLSLRRADSALNLLAYYKVSRKRMDTWGLGAKEPVASNATEDGRAKNRRVEFIVLYNYDRSTKPKD